MRQAAPLEAQTNSGPPSVAPAAEPWSNDEQISPHRRQRTEQVAARQLQPREPSSDDDIKLYDKNAAEISHPVDIFFSSDKR
ncbi:MAG TPA: hypothetical protein VHN14_14070 [Kofleriaceae bacterium]|jgi:hypothetical protein|nr:hypothetical protein [Kofleriaceae bacterium]